MGYADLAMGQRWREAQNKMNVVVVHSRSVQADFLTLAQCLSVEEPEGGILKRTPHPLFIEWNIEGNGNKEVETHSCEPGVCVRETHTQSPPSRLLVHVVTLSLCTQTRGVCVCARTSVFVCVFISVAVSQSKTTQCVCATSRSAVNQETKPPGRPVAYSTSMLSAECLCVRDYFDLRVFADVMG